MTISLAAVAAFGALLGGVFSDSGLWVPGFPLSELEHSRNLVITLTFTSFIISTVASTLGMTHAANCIYTIGTLKKPEDITCFQQAQLRWLSRRVLSALLIILSFGFGVLMFLVFIYENVRL